MEKLKALGWQKLVIVSAVFDVVFGLILGIAMKGILVGLIVGIVAAVVAGVFIFALCGDEIAGHSKSDKYKKLFMNLPIGFAHAKIITDSMGNNVGYCIEEANEKFGSYFNLDITDYENKILGESKIDVLQD
ncbi:MAG: hybrid sensor histidine kinase/response regulator, partial [Lachnospiraceae bacterium]|nr:hybrid sensor histidine kinase/response regulator [Lachnospiraceae bacterium]